MKVYKKSILSVSETVSTETGQVWRQAPYWRNDHLLELIQIGQWVMTKQ